MKYLFVFVLFTIGLTSKILAQDTLPRISVKNQYGEIIISWKNTYGAKISNINIQRSRDSIKRFITIGTVLNPMNRENGYVDSKQLEGRIFYRVFVAFEGGDYVFTKSYQPVIDTSVSSIAEFITEENNTRPPGITGFVPSKLIFTGRDNNVIINLPGALNRKFSVKFFDEYDNFVFEINSIKEPYLILEKVNFLHSGWFKYHLFDNNNILEKYKFYIPKDGRNPGNNRDQRK